MTQSETSYKNYLSSQHAKAASGIKSACRALDEVVSGSTDDEIDSIIGFSSRLEVMPCK